MIDVAVLCVERYGLRVSMRGPPLENGALRFGVRVEEKDFCWKFYTGSTNAVFIQNNAFFFLLRGPVCMLFASFSASRGGSLRIDHAHVYHRLLVGL